jgi:hypothetical protein
MKSVNLSELNEQELIQEAKKQKNIIITLGCLIGLMTIAYSDDFYHQGFRSSMLLPICFIPILISKQKKYKAVQNEIQSRKA